MHIGQTNHSYNDALLESVDIRQIYDKFPEKKGGLKELFAKGPQNSFFLIKFWVSESLQRMSICLAIHRPLTPNMHGTIIHKRRHRNAQLVQEKLGILLFRLKNKHICSVLCHVCPACAKVSTLMRAKLPQFMFTTHTTAYLTQIFIHRVITCMNNRAFP